MSDAPPDITTSVVIVGYGPAGAALANLLGMRGIPTLVLEREAGTYHLPRAVHFDDEVMRVWQTIALADEIAPLTHVSPGMRFVDAEGRLLLDWSRPMEIGPHGWHQSYRFHQPDLERVLRAGAARWPDVQLRTRSEVYAVEQTGRHAIVAFENLTNGRLHRVAADWVVGCDGARSLIRRLIGGAYADLGFHEPWLVVDMLLTRDKPELGDYSIQHCDPARSATYVRGTGRRRRWEIRLNPGEDPATATRPERVWDLLSKWLAPDEAEIERAACYTFHSIVAERWRDRRLLIAGDAAHQTPPFLGQGMCAGIRDVANLAWKLERVITGRAEPDLLDLYQAERAPNVHDYIALAVKLGGLINTQSMAAALPAGAAPDRPAAMRTVKPPLGPGLWVAGAEGAGQLAPQPLLADGARLDDRIGYRFGVVATPEIARALDAALLKRKDVALVADAGPAVAAWLDGLGAGAALLRPDRYLLGTARDAAGLHDLVAMI